MPRKDFFDITVILDRSGSMAGRVEDTITSYNKFLREQKEVPGDGNWTLIQFDDQYEVNYSNVPEKQAKELTTATYVPRGGTALIDAICRTIDEKNEYFATLAEEKIPEKVMMVIITDGHENQSHIYRKKYLDLHPEFIWTSSYYLSALPNPEGKIRLVDDPGRIFLNEKIAASRAKGWEFLFLAATPDAFTTAASYGISKGNTLSWLDETVGGAFVASSSTISSMKLSSVESYRARSSNLLTPDESKQKDKV